jgi:GTPase SAR1 family protein
MELNSRESHVKVLVIGDPLVGKTNFITSFVDYNTSFETLCGQNNPFQVSYSTKVVKNISSRPDESFKFHIWDITDYDENKSLIDTYMENTQIVMLCFSLKNPDSLDSLKYWLDQKKSNLKYILIGLKANFNNKVNKEEVINLYKTYNLEYYEFKDLTSFTPPTIIKPFIHYLDYIYPKVEIIIIRENNSMLNNIISYCTIL